MIKTLLKKQMMESFSWLYQNRKTGKNRDTKGIITYVILYLIIFGFLGMVFFQFACTLCAPLISLNLGWLYFALMGLIAISLGVFGSVFNTYASLYKAKDNDLLLSMPVPTMYILTARLSGVYVMGLMYEIIVMIPTLIAWFMYADCNVAGIVFSILIPFIMSLFVLSLSCVLGWVVALVSSKLKNQKIVTVALCIVFFMGYYYVCGNTYTIIEKILMNPEGVGRAVKGILFPLYHMGLAAEGNIISMLIFTGIFAALFSIVYFVLAGSFIKLATANRGTAKVKYVRKKEKEASPDSALLRKEFKRFFGSVNYMLNCGLGLIFMVIGAVVILVKQGTIKEILTQMEGYQDFVYLLVAAGICMITSMNDMTAPSISLEGKNLWLIKSLPVTSKQILNAKLKMHLILTLIPTVLLVGCVEWVITPTVPFAVLILMVSCLFVILMAELGLIANLKMPNFTWKNETVPIKQSAGVMIALFGGWVLVILLCVLYFLVRSIFTPLLYLGIVTALVFVVNFLMYRWLCTKGSELFDSF